MEMLNERIQDLDESLVVNVHEVHHVFTHDKVSKATGPDGISNKVLRLCSHQLAWYLHVFINQSWIMVSFPKIGNVELSFRYQKLNTPCEV